MVNSHKTLQAKPVKTARAICMQKSNGFHPDITKHIKEYVLKKESENTVITMSNGKTDAFMIVLADNKDTGNNTCIYIDLICKTPTLVNVSLLPDIIAIAKESGIYALLISPVAIRDANGVSYIPPKLIQYYRSCGFVDHEKETELISPTYILRLQPDTASNDPKTDIDSENDTDVDSEKDTDVDSENDTDVESESEEDIDSENGTDVKSESDTVPKTEESETIHFDMKAVMKNVMYTCSILAPNVKRAAYIFHRKLLLRNKKLYHYLKTVVPTSSCNRNIRIYSPIQAYKTAIDIYIHQVCTDSYVHYKAYRKATNGKNKNGAMIFRNMEILDEQVEVTKDLFDNVGSSLARGNLNIPYVTVKHVSFSL
jgi:hypothetical protein